MSKKVVRRLGVRLNHLFQWVNSAQSFDHIWDLCCDHGRLGLHLHAQHPHARIYLVDKVPKIIDKLVADYGALNDGRLVFKTADVCQLNIVAAKRTLVIIAGVGGQNIISMLEAILAKLNNGDTLEFVLSPNAHMFELRVFLRDKNFTLVDEAFVVENRFSHEHLWLRYSHNKPPLINADVEGFSFREVSAIGDSLWCDMTDAKRQYIAKLLKHYQRMLDNGDKTVSQPAIEAYSRIVTG